MENAGHLVRVKKKRSVYDFTDKSDCKTGSIFLDEKGNENKRTYVGAIDGLSARNRTGTLTPKPGAIRAIIYNPYIEELWYYFFPRNVWIELAQNNRNDMRFNWNPNKNYIKKLHGYEVDTFKDLANMRTSDFK